MGISALGNYTSREVVQTIDEKTVTWRVRVMTPADGARAGVGLDAFAAAVAVAGSDDEDAKAQAATMTLDKIADVAEWADRVACQAVSHVKVASADDPGEWEAVRLVFPALEDLQATPPRMSVAMLAQGSDVAQEVAAAATSAMQGAAESARSFRGSE